MTRKIFLQGITAAVGLLFGWRKAKAACHVGIDPAEGVDQTVVVYRHPSGEAVTITAYYLDDGGIYESVDGKRFQKISNPYWHGKSPVFRFPAPSDAKKW